MRQIGQLALVVGAQGCLPKGFQCSKSTSLERMASFATAKPILGWSGALATRPSRSTPGAPAEDSFVATKKTHSMAERSTADRQ